MDDLESDFSVFHRVDMLTLDGPTFFARALRLAAYEGVMRVRALAEEDESTPHVNAPRADGVTVVDDGIMLAQLTQSGDLEYHRG
jgi:hypothetical protein